MIHLRMRWLAAALWLALPAWAEESFYQVIDPNGGVMIIRGEKEAPPANSGEALKPSKAASAPATPPAEAARVAPPATTAGYDSGDYTEAEALDETLKQQESAQKRFYFINDNGPGVVNMQEGGTAVAAEGVELFSGNAEVGQGGKALPDALVVYAAEAARAQWPILASCRETSRLKPLAEVGKLALTVILDRRAYSFPDAPGVLLTGRVSGDGPRSLQVQSYSAVARAPAYPLPPLALLGADGCLSRVVSGYAERAYDATDGRYPMVAGEILMHSEERYLLLLAQPDAPAAEVPYKTSPYGQMIFSLKK